MLGCTMDEDAGVSDAQLAAGGFSAVSALAPRVHGGVVPQNNTFATFVRLFIDGTFTAIHHTGMSVDYSPKY